MTRASVLWRVPRLLGIFALLPVFWAGPAISLDDEEPQPSVNCKKKKNKNHPKCKNKRSQIFNDHEVVNSAYWLSRQGKHAAALEVLKLADNRDHPRVLNAVGFSTRHLGDVDAALPYYHRALELRPDYVEARQYLGEALLSKGDLAAAQGQLEAIERTCGVNCVAYEKLAIEIAKFNAG